MSAPTTFKPSIRDAGELTDQRIYGSFRSLHRFEAPIHKSKHEDIFKSKEYESSLPPKVTNISKNQEQKNTDETNTKKSSSKEKAHRSKRHEDGRRSKNRTRHEDKAKDEAKENFKEKEKQKEKDQENKDDEFIKYLGERHERRRKKQVINEETTTISNSANEKENHLESSSLRKMNLFKEKQQKPESDQYIDPKKTEKPAKLDRQQFITHTNAFSAGSKSGDSSDLDENNPSNKVEDDIKVEVLRQHFKPEPEIVNKDCDFFKSIKNFQTAEFILTPAPQGQTVNCKVLCRRGIISEYQFLLEQANTANILLMKTHRKMATAKATHFIDIVNYNDAGLRASNEVSCAKVSSNMGRKKFKLNVDNNNFPLVESNILNVIFKSNSGEPRKVIATTCLMAGTSGSKEKVTYVLKNRPPHFDINMRKFVLNYNGRAKQSSKNNFQIFDESFPDEILMQLGKVETGEYNCDYTWPLCAMQAFGLAISSLSR